MAEQFLEDLYAADPDAELIELEMKEIVDLQGLLPLIAQFESAEKVDFLSYATAVFSG